LASQSHLNVPIIQQSSNFSCGSAALLACLHYWRGENIGIDHEADLWKPLDISAAAGTEPESMVAVANRFGLYATHMLGMTVEQLRVLLSRGYTVILCLQAWKQTAVPYSQDWEDGHYVVAVGMDASAVYFMDPAVHTAYASLPITELPKRWHSPDTDGSPQYGMAIIVRGRAPAVAPNTTPML